MKRLLTLSLLGSSLLTGLNSAKADTNFHFVQNGAEGDEIYRSTVNNGITSFEFITKHSVEIDPINALETESYWYDESLNKLFFQEYSSPGVYTGKHAVYDLNENTWTSITISSDNGNTQYPYLTIPTSNSNSIASNASNISSNDTDIASNASSISTNSSSISTNSSSISSNDTDIASNASNISSNDTDIASNASNISSNDTDIASNASSISTNSSNISSNDTDISALQGLISTKSGSTTTARIGDSTKNTLEIGPTTNPTTIDQSGISVSGGNLIKKDSDGNIHIGKNSFVIGDDVLNGAHPIWAEDENGTKIPLNIYGSDLQINGVSVQEQINTNKTNIKNLGSGVAGSTALTAALTALPQTSKESKLSCGVGSGAYSSRYAVGFGCASKLNERVDINAGGSYVFGGSKSYGEGTLDSGVVKAGFVFKLGELNEPTQISMKEKKELKQEISILKENNQNILAQNQALLARLERLEKIALGASKSQDLAVYKLK